MEGVRRDLFSSAISFKAEKTLSLANEDTGSARTRNATAYKFWKLRWAVIPKTHVTDNRPKKAEGFCTNLNGTTTMKTTEYLILALKFRRNHYKIIPISGLEYLYHNARIQNELRNSSTTNFECSSTQIEACQAIVVKAHTIFLLHGYFNLQFLSKTICCSSDSTWWGLISSLDWITHFFDPK